MKQIWILLALSAIINHLYGQVADSSDTWNDTTYKTIALSQSIKDKKVIRYDYGESSVFYLSYSDFKSLCAEWAAEKTNWNAKEYRKLLKQLEHKAKSNDTLRFNIYNTDDVFTYLVSDLLKKGNASVFNKRENEFADTIYHRLERYGLMAFRFYYFQDKRAFFNAMEYSGILNECQPFIDLRKDYEDYLKLGQRLQETLK